MDFAEILNEPRQDCVMPHLALKSIYWAIDGSATRHDGCVNSRRNRKRITEAFVWAKTVSGIAQTVYRGFKPEPTALS